MHIQSGPVQLAKGPSRDGDSTRRKILQLHINKRDVIFIQDSGTGNITSTAAASIIKIEAYRGCHGTTELLVVEGVESATRCSTSAPVDGAMSSCPIEPLI